MNAKTEIVSTVTSRLRNSLGKLAPSGGSLTRNVVAGTAMGGTLAAVSTESGQNILSEAASVMTGAVMSMSREDEIQMAKVWQHAVDHGPFVSLVRAGYNTGLLDGKSDLSDRVTFVQSMFNWHDKDILIMLDGLN